MHTSVDDPVTHTTDATPVEPVLDPFSSPPRRRWSWWPAPGSWSDADFLRRVFTTIVVLGTSVFVAVNVHIEKVFWRNTPTGGDMGAHVWAPAFLRDHLLPNLRISGWSMDWYGGLPVYRFYMLPPALVMVFLNGLLHIPYGIAFKMVVVLGVCTMPLNAWLLGRFSKLPWPLPEFMAVAAVLFLFDENFTIYGGNIPSTMAGEFSFSISLSLTLLGFGLLARALDTGRGLGMAAAVLALAAVCHGIVAIFVAVGVLVFMALWLDRRRWKWILATLVTFGLLTAWWILPFTFSTHYMTNMKYEPYEGPWWKFFNPQSTQMTWFLIVFAVVGFVASIVRRNRTGIFLGLMCAIWVGLVIAAQNPFPSVGELFWNYRGLPFVYLTRYLLAMIGIAETVRFLLRAWTVNRMARRLVPDLVALGAGGAAGPDSAIPPPASDEPGPELAAAGPWGDRPLPSREEIEQRSVWVQGAAMVLVGLLSLGWIAFAIDRLPGSKQVYEDGKWKHQWWFIKGDVVSDGADSDGWSSYNFSGYEGRATWNEHRSLLETSKALGSERGCGRALWEHQSDKYGNYGTPMALMLLPFWTDGCVSSMEGLFFEASGTTPYHFIAASAASENASDPVRQLRYDKNNIDLAVRYMRDLGVRYYYAFSEVMVEKAAKHPDLYEVAVSDPWHIYEIRDWSLVVPLTSEPLVVQHRPGDERERWLEVGSSYFQRPQDWKGVLVDDGPATWQRIDVEPDPSRAAPGRVAVLNTRTEHEQRAVEPFEIDPSSIRLEQDSIAFEVPEEAIGRPVLVRVSYFPNWRVTGAEGPYRAAPNFMVVVPTSTSVKFSYGYSGLDLSAYGMTLAGIGLLVFFWRRRVVDFSKPVPEPFSGLGPDPDRGADASPIPPIALDRSDPSQFFDGPAAPYDPVEPRSVLDTWELNQPPPGHDPGDGST